MIALSYGLDEVKCHTHTRIEQDIIKMRSLFLVFCAHGAVDEEYLMCGCPQLLKAWMNFIKETSPTLYKSLIYKYKFKECQPYDTGQINKPINCALEGNSLHPQPWSGLLQLSSHHS